MNAAAAQLQLDGEQASISGDMTAATLPELIRQHERINWPAQTRLDLQQVERVDSAALATLMHWTLLANQQQRQLSIINPPQNLVAIAQLSQLETLFSAA